MAPRGGFLTFMLATHGSLEKNLFDTVCPFTLLAKPHCDVALAFKSKVIDANLRVCVCEVLCTTVCLADPCCGFCPHQSPNSQQCSCFFLIPQKMFGLQMPLSRTEQASVHENLYEIQVLSNQRKLDEVQSI